MKTHLIAASISLLLMGAASAQAQGIQVTPAGSAPSSIAPAENFSGHAVVNRMVAGDSAQYGSVGKVDFAPGARSAWHTHPAGQLLIVTDGKGWVQEEGQPRHEIRAGDVVWIEPNVNHWHGATDTTSMGHISVAYMQDSRAVDWLERVSDEEYQEPDQATENP
ncbi:Cupin domain protein [Franzmannia pantelleriensis]|uniref:Cupin domain protein n=1 Tax=Franzmannia pantelleriensis TaxID=48727 RepID=A0A1G9R745_9GAMM|nr:cupin domain-containing protein [Halomonas pantelleriensis]SDM19132.1 Cupin domain protein [Halomonas pantelleriensis]